MSAKVLAPVLMGLGAAALMKGAQVRRRAMGNPLYVNGQLFQQPVVISHVPGPGVAGVLRGFGIDPSMGGLGSYAVYQPTRGMPRGFGADEAPVVVSPSSSGPAPIVFRAPTALEWALAAAGIASTAGLIYHGYKRNDSVGWAIGWGILGGIAPIIAWPVAVAQGYGKRKGLTANRRYRRNGKAIKARPKKAAPKKAAPKKAPVLSKRVAYIETYLDKERGPAWRLKAGAMAKNRKRRRR